MSQPLHSIRPFIGKGREGPVGVAGLFSDMKPPYMSSSAASTQTLGPMLTSNPLDHSEIPSLFQTFGNGDASSDDDDDGQVEAAAGGVSVPIRVRDQSNSLYQRRGSSDSFSNGNYNRLHGSSLSLQKTMGTRGASRVHAVGRVADDAGVSGRDHGGQFAAAHSLPSQHLHFSNSQQQPNPQGTSTLSMSNNRYPLSRSTTHNPYAYSNQTEPAGTSLYSADPGSVATTSFLGMTYHNTMHAAEQREAGLISPTSADVLSSTLHRPSCSNSVSQCQLTFHFNNSAEVIGNNASTTGSNGTVSTSSPLVTHVKRQPISHSPNSGAGEAELQTPQRRSGHPMSASAMEVRVPATTTVGTLSASLSDLRSITVNVKQRVRSTAAPGGVSSLGPSPSTSTMAMPASLIATPAATQQQRQQWSTGDRSGATSAPTSSASQPPSSVPCSTVFAEYGQTNEYAQPVDQAAEAMRATYCVADSGNDAVQPSHFVPPLTYHKVGEEEFRTLMQPLETSSYQPPPPPQQQQQQQYHQKQQLYHQQQQELPYQSSQQEQQPNTVYPMPIHQMAGVYTAPTPETPFPVVNLQTPYDGSTGVLYPVPVQMQAPLQQVAAPAPTAGTAGKAKSVQRKRVPYTATSENQYLFHSGVPAKAAETWKHSNGAETAAAPDAQWSGQNQKQQRRAIERPPVTIGANGVPVRVANNGASVKGKEGGGGGDGSRAIAATTASSNAKSPKHQSGGSAPRTELEEGPLAGSDAAVQCFIIVKRKIEGQRYACCLPAAEVAVGRRVLVEGDRGADIGVVLGLVTIDQMARDCLSIQVKSKVAMEKAQRERGRTVEQKTGVVEEEGIAEDPTAPTLTGEAARQFVLSLKSWPRFLRFATAEDEQKVPTLREEELQVLSVATPIVHQFIENRYQQRLSRHAAAVLTSNADNADGADGNGNVGAVVVGGVSLPKRSAGTGEAEEEDEEDGRPTRRPIKALTEAEFELLRLSREVALVECEYQFTKEKLTLYVKRPLRSIFVDFRHMQRKLYRTFRCRIWIAYMDEVADDEDAPASYVFVPPSTLTAQAHSSNNLEVE